MPLQNLKDIHPMEYQAQNQEEIDCIKKLNKPLRELYDLVDGELPESADKTVLLRKFLELRTQLNQTIVLNGVKQ